MVVDAHVQLHPEGRQPRGGTRVAKEPHRHSTRRIDLAVCAIMAHSLAVVPEPVPQLFVFARPSCSVEAKPCRRSNRGRVGLVDELRSQDCESVLLHDEGFPRALIEVEFLLEVLLDPVQDLAGRPVLDQGQQHDQRSDLGLEPGPPPWSRTTTPSATSSL
jgi:hypothetical protein